MINLLIKFISVAVKLLFYFQVMFQNKCFKFCKTLKDCYLSSNCNESSKLINFQQRQITFLMDWFIRIFNGVDRERVRLVGPDCACAEWLLRNGALARFKGHSALLSNYDELIHLEETNSNILKIEEIYAKNASLNHIGFDHLIGCNHIKKMTFIFCSYLTDSALFKLKYVKNSLEFLELTSCFNIADKGLEALCELSNLKTLILADLFSVKNKDACEIILRKALPNCTIEFKK